MAVQRSDFGTTPDGQKISLYTLTNKRNCTVRVIDYGAILVSVDVPDREGRIENVNLGYSTLDGYLARHPYFGATVGRFCNRIDQGRFSLDGKTYQLAINNGPCHLHGGIIGFDKLIWKATAIDGEVSGVQFNVVSPDGQEGYPGNLDVIAGFTWNNDNELAFSFAATTDQPTVLNLTNHAYWNLSGAGNGTIHHHRLKLECDRFLPVDQNLIPTGQLSSVEGTGLDFRQQRTIGERIDLFPATKGYDHCYVVNGQPGKMRLAARVEDPASGRTMEVETTQPGMQLYTGNHLSGEFPQHAGFCLETQHFPDAPNKPTFPTTRLNPGETFFQTTIHRFGAI
jgi:aldose 1-epimerase